MNKLTAGLLVVVAAVVSGCEDSDVPPVAATAGQSAPAPAQAPAATPVTAPPPSAAAAPEQPAPPVQRQVAEAGVGKKGQGYGGGIITEPVHQYFVVQDRIIFEIQIPEAMKLFQAEHNRYPKDMKEFQRAILDPGSIVLPDLRPGERYVYDAQQHELMVERPAP